MKIKSVRIRNFKRFTDLTIEGLPESAKLVVLLGPNGSGKSSLFDAFNIWVAPSRKRGFPNQNITEDYYLKTGFRDRGNFYPILDNIQIKAHGSQEYDYRKNKIPPKAFYFRSAYRYEPYFQIQNISQIDDMLSDRRSPPTLISQDVRVSDNYLHLVSDMIQNVFDEGKIITNEEMRAKVIDKINRALRHVFEDLRLASFGNPTNKASFLFEKGISKNYPYKNLSGGEKAAFDLLLDFFVKSQIFDDTVFCIDEPELHMHTKLQGNLLEEMYKQLPSTCQLWIATHSIGMMRRATELYEQNPGEVIFLDFGDHNFDETSVMYPKQVTRQFWKDVFSVALDDLADLIAPNTVIFCEGRAEDSTKKRRNNTFDAEIYRRIFEIEYPFVEFIPLGGVNDIEKNAILLENVLGNLFNKSLKMFKVYDRDDRSDEEITEAREQDIHILSRRDIENYLWDDEILELLCKKHQQSNKLAEVLTIKQTEITKLPARGKPKDDIKAASGSIYVQVKKLLGLTQCGSTAEAFAKATLIPLITPDTKVYQQLKTDIFGTGE